MPTTIKLDHKTRERLANMGKKNESYDTILNRLMDITEKHREDVLDAIDEWLDSDDHLSLYKWEVREKTRALRSIQQQTGGGSLQGVYKS